MTINIDNFIPIRHPSEDMIPVGTEFIPISYIKDGKEEWGWAMVTPDLLDEEKIEKEKARILDIEIDNALKKEKQ